MDCNCEFRNVGEHGDECSLGIRLIARLEAAKERTIVAQDFESAAAIRDAILHIRKTRSTADKKE